MLFLLQFPGVSFVRYFISIFHLPIFFFVAGYFSKIRPGECVKSFKRLMIPYLIFCMVFSAFTCLIGWGMQPLFIYPPMALWFLVALFFMKAFLPIVDRLKYPLTTAFIIALLIGFIEIDPNILGITRFFAFYPVFLIGFYYDDYKAIYSERLPELLDNKYVIIALAVIVLAMCAFTAKYFDAKIIVLAEPYAKPTELIKRFIVLALGIGVTLILHKLASNRDYFLTKIGRNSMAVYLLHPYFVVSIQVFAGQILKQNEPIYWIFSLSATIIIVFILSRDIVTASLNRLTDFAYYLIFKHEDK